MTTIINAFVSPQPHKGYFVQIKSLDETDRAQVEFLDAMSENNVADMLDSDGYGWGIFREDRLLGYCTIGGVEGTEHQKIAEELDEVSTSRTLSDVYIHPYCRGLGLGSILISNLFQHVILPDNISKVFCTIFNERQYNFYERLGFRELDGGILYHSCKEETEEK